MRYLVLDFYVLSCAWERRGGEGSKQCPQLGRLRAFIFSFSVWSDLWCFVLAIRGELWRTAHAAVCPDPCVSRVSVVVLTAVLFSYLFSSLQHHGGEDRERGARAGRLQEGHRSSLQRGGERLARVRGSRGVGGQQGGRQRGTCMCTCVLRRGGC